MPNNILSRIRQHKSGWIFNASDFLDLAQRNTIDQTLKRLAGSNMIVKVSTGLYCIPDKHVLVGDIPPRIDDIVQIYAKKHGYQIQVSPAKAANLLGLSQQVPSQYFYITNGPSRKLRFNGIQVVLNHVCPKKLLGIGTKAGLIIQALYNFGKDKINDDILKKIKAIMDNEDKENLKSWLSFVPHWMQKEMFYLTTHG